MASIKLMMEKSYLTHTLLAFSILKSEEVEEFVAMDPDFKSFEWCFEFLKILETKLADKNFRITIEALKIIQICTDKFLVETKPSVKKYKMLDEFKKVYDLFKGIKKICLYLIENKNESLAFEAFKTIKSFEDCYFTEDLIEENDKRKLIRAINSQHWQIRVYSARQILSSVFIAEEDEDKERNTIPIDNTILS